MAMRAIPPLHPSAVATAPSSAANGRRVRLTARARRACKWLSRRPGCDGDDDWLAADPCTQLEQQPRLSAAPHTAVDEAGELSRLGSSAWA
eukprot:3426713-Prymnesium_polylepis.1